MAAAIGGPVAIRGEVEFEGLQKTRSLAGILRMEESLGRRRTGPPHNPGVRELISGKQQWRSPSERQDAKHGFRSWSERGYLPHRDVRGLTQFVTFRLVHAMPPAVRWEWEALLKMEDKRERRKKLHAYLDAGRGDCALRRPAIGALVDGALRFNHNVTYSLWGWVVMPNHVHVLFHVTARPMPKVIADWKHYTAREANRILGRSGPFLAKNFWDTYIRDSAHESRVLKYMEDNPIKARLARTRTEWPSSSARFRDEHGQLQI